MLIFMVAFSCFANGGKETAPVGKSDAKKAVFLVNGNLGDKGFYDLCAEGMYQLRDKYGYEVKIIEMGRDETAYEGYYRDVSEQDWDVILSSTWSIKEIYEEVAADYPDNKYIYLDGANSLPNEMGISYLSNETGFMAGLLAAMMLDVNDPLIDKGNRTLGFIGSMDTANINDFLVGYIDGIKLIDPTIKLLCAYVGSFENVATCLEMTTQLYNQGAQIVYTPTSQSQLGAVTASMNCKKYMITCDTDVYTQLVESNPEMVKYLLSSSMKKADASIITAVTGLFDGTRKLGESYTLGLSTGTVGLADNANFRALVPADIHARLDQYAKDRMAGKIDIHSAYEMTQDEVVAMRKSMNP